ncbi:MAG: alpha/beta hydrolase [Candidatus Bathyarchaeota archaeon]|nr:alpha/beta hydrolase [Candidatus Bathyarchaeota archaeon]
MEKIFEEYVKIPILNQTIEGNLSQPPNATGIVLFAHGSGSGRFSPRNQAVAKTLNNANIATLLIDLLTQSEEEIDVSTGQYRFDITLLANRLLEVTNWIKQRQDLKTYPIGYFGASTGAAAAIIAATNFPDEIKAVVSRGGRPDLAMDYLPKIRVPTLFIVGGNDLEVLELNRQAFALVRGERKLEVVSGASHLFEEPGALEQVAELSADWFLAHFTGLV